MSRTLLIMVALVALAASAQAAPAAEAHFRPRFSRLECRPPFAKPCRYLPVGYNRDFDWYRFDVTLEITNQETADPSAGSLAHLNTVATGIVKDTATGKVVGTWNQDTIALPQSALPGAPIEFIVQQVMELGRETDDAIIFTGSFEADLGTLLSTDFDLAITGGNGQYLGAVGDAAVAVGDNQRATVTVWVPKLPKF